MKRAAGSGGDLGFTTREASDGIVIFHRGRKAATLRGSKAEAFRSEMARLPEPQQQQLMARLTGNYKRGNERLARNHPRNRGPGRG